MSDPQTNADWQDARAAWCAENGRKGGQKSRRKLSKREARRIASAGWEGAVGEARRAKLHAKTHNDPSCAAGGTEGGPDAR
jgi:hypothetical protein